MPARSAPTEPETVIVSSATATDAIPAPASVAVCSAGRGEATAAPAETPLRSRAVVVAIATRPLNRFLALCMILSSRQGGAHSRTFSLAALIHTGKGSRQQWPHVDRSHLTEHRFFRNPSETFYNGSTKRNLSDSHRHAPAGAAD